MVVCDAFKSILKQDIQPEDITVKHFVVSVRGSQGLKNEMFIKKKALLDYIARKAINFKVTDIK